MSIVRQLTRARFERLRANHLLHRGELASSDVHRGVGFRTSLQALRVLGGGAVEFAALEYYQLLRILGRLLGALVLLILTASFTGSFWLLALFVAPLCIERVLIVRRARRRSEEFERDYSALLLSLASSVRAGLDPLVALTRSAQLFSEGSVVASELSEFEERIEQGAQELEAVNRFGSSVDFQDVRMFRTVFSLSRREGASLSHSLERLVRVTRQRQSFRRKVRAAVALQKFSAFGIAGCAVTIITIQTLTNLESIQIALSNTISLRAFVLGGGLILTGLIWMMRSTSTDHFEEH